MSFKLFAVVLVALAISSTSHSAPIVNSDSIVARDGDVPNLSSRDIIARNRPAGMIVRRNGPEFYEAIGRKGGEAAKQAHGHEFYEAIGKKGGKKGGESTRDKLYSQLYVGGLPFGNGV